MITIKRSQTCNGGGSFTFFIKGDKKFICPAWIEVPMDTELKDVAVEEIPKAPQIKVTPDKEWTFTGSKGNMYSVTRNMGSYACTCPASMFQKFKDCKHVVQAKAEENLL